MITAIINKLNPGELWFSLMFFTLVAGFTVSSVVSSIAGAVRRPPKAVVFPNQKAALDAIEAEDQPSAASD